jgi:hypothetical protein
MVRLPQKIYTTNRQSIPYQIQKHMQAIRNNNNSGYSNHILNTGHKCGNVTDTMDIISTQRKGKHLNSRKIPHAENLQK